MAQVIDGKKIAENIKSQLKEMIRGLNPAPGLAVIQVGSNPASTSYVNSKEKDCREIGYYSKVYRLAEDTPEEDVLLLIDKLNADDKIHGILVQLPLPAHISEEKTINRVSAEKDVDGFTHMSAGRLMTGGAGHVACTPKGCIELIKGTGTEIKGKNAVVIGRSNIVGKPMAILLLAEHATVTICHSRTRNLPAIASKADILVAAIGKYAFVTADMVKDGAIVIDVGINRVEGKLKGDVDFDSVFPKASFITPVPGGVGPMTRAMLMKNTLDAYKMLHKP